MVKYLKNACLFKKKEFLLTRKHFLNILKMLKNYFLLTYVNPKQL